MMNTMEIVERYQITEVPYGTATLVADVPIEAEIIDWGGGSYRARTLDLDESVSARGIKGAKAKLLREIARAYAYWVDAGRVHPLMHEGYRPAGVEHAVRLRSTLRLVYAHPADERVALAVRDACRAMGQAHLDLRRLAKDARSHPFIDAAWDCFTNMSSYTSYQITHPTTQDGAKEKNDGNQP